MPSFKDSLISVFFKVLKGRKIYKLPWWPISMWNSPHTFIQERMKKSPLWHKNHHLQRVTENEEVTAHFFFLPWWGRWMTSHSLNFPLCSAWNHYDPVNVKWKEIKNSCQAMYVILGKWEVERNSWISSFPFTFSPHSFLSDFPLVTSISPGSFSPEHLSVSTA